MVIITGLLRTLGALVGVIRDTSILPSLVTDMVPAVFNHQELFHVDYSYLHDATLNLTLLLNLSFK